ncbi:hypothetical protein GBA52_008392 [Prunus armeniaca]|nr:hypothetical protein GBA52_008392 [Prunus armeniaca]
MSDEEPKSTGRLYKFIKSFLGLSIVALVIEVIAYFKNWNLNLIQPWEVQGLVKWSYMTCGCRRYRYVVPKRVACGSHVSICTFDTMGAKRNT